MPGTCDSREVTTSAISSWFLTRTITTKSNSPVTEYASATPGTSASAGPSLAIADRSASISTMAVTTKGILSPRLLIDKALTPTNICSYNSHDDDGGWGDVGQDQLPARGFGPRP